VTRAYEIQKDTIREYLSNSFPRIGPIRGKCYSIYMHTGPGVN